MKMSSKVKKQRTIYTPQQVCYLEEKFAEQDFPNKFERKQIAEHLKLSEQHVQIWFQNKRAKQKRKQKKMEKDEGKVLVPKPPPFWPQQLSFNSTFQVIQHNETENSKQIDAHDHQDYKRQENNSSGPKTPTRFSVSPSSNVLEPTLVSEKTKSPCNGTGEVAAAEGEQDELQCATNGYQTTDLNCQKISYLNGVLCMKCTNGENSSESRNHRTSEGQDPHVDSRQKEHCSVVTSVSQRHSFADYQLLSNPLLLLANCATQLHSLEVSNVSTNTPSSHTTDKEKLIV